LIILTFILSICIANYVVLLKKRHLHETLTKLISLSPRLSHQIPVTIVTGFLGAGKTVLLNRLLSNPGKRKICVIENELGAVSIDHSLLAPASNSNSASNGGVLVLKNGCVCCSASGSGDELVRTLDKLLSLSTSTVLDESNKESPETAFNYVVIETSGVVDPAPLVQAFFKSALASARYRLDSVITVVDAKNIGRHLDTNGFLSRAAEAGQQVAYADVVLINKVDIATLEERTSANTAVRKVNPTAKVFECSNCEVNVEMLLDSHSFDVSKAGAMIDSQLEEEHGGDSFSSKSVTARHSGISSMTLDAHNLSIPLTELLDWLKTLVSTHSESLYRVKGLLHVSEGQNLLPTLFAVHGVHTDLQGARVELAEAAAAQVKAAIVLIGRGLDSAELQRQFREKVLSFATTISLPTLSSCCDIHHTLSGVAVSSLDLRRRRTGSGPALVGRLAQTLVLLLSCLLIQPSSGDFLSTHMSQISGILEPGINMRTIFLQTATVVASGGSASMSEQVFSWPIIVPQEPEHTHHKQDDVCSSIDSVSIDLVGLEHMYANSMDIFLRKGSVEIQLSRGAGAAEKISSLSQAQNEPPIVSFLVDFKNSHEMEKKTLSSYTGKRILSSGMFDSEHVFSNSTVIDSIEGPWQLDIRTQPLQVDSLPQGILASLSTWVLFISCNNNSISREYEAGVVVRVKSYPKFGKLYAATNYTENEKKTNRGTSISYPAPFSLLNSPITKTSNIGMQADFEQCLLGQLTQLTKSETQIQCLPAVESTTYSSIQEINQEDSLIPLDWLNNRHSVIYERHDDNDQETYHDEFFYSIESTHTYSSLQLYKISLEIGIRENQPSYIAINRFLDYTSNKSRKKTDDSFQRLHDLLGSRDMI
jgi:G3E family GTPase